MNLPKHGIKRLAVEALIAKASGKSRVERIQAVMWDIDKKLCGSGNSADRTFAETGSELAAKFDILEQLWQEAVRPSDLDT